MKVELLTYTVRPNGTPLYLPTEIMTLLRLGHGQKLTAEQYQSPAVQDLLARRIAEETKGKDR